ncbi:unnamed protein product [Leuciscus chuanchicus]
MGQMLLLVLMSCGIYRVIGTLNPVKIFLFVNQPKAFDEAQRYCRDTYTDLVTLWGRAEMEELFAHENFTFTGSAWIGLRGTSRQLWQWALADQEFYKDGETEYRNWGPNEPTNTDGEYCSVMDDVGKLRDTTCQNNEQKYILINELKSWREAQSYCRQFHTDLVSVRNPDENLQIQLLIPTGVSYIGLFRDAFAWSDNSTSSFRNWDLNQPDGSGECVALQLQNRRLWEDETCSSPRPFFCYATEGLFERRPLRYTTVHYCTLPLLYTTVLYLYCTLLYSTSTVHHCTLPLLYPYCTLPLLYLYCTLPLPYSTSTILYLYCTLPLLYTTVLYLYCTSTVLYLYCTLPLPYSTSTVLYLYCTLPLLYSTSTSTVYYLYCTLPLLCSTSTVLYLYYTLPLLYSTTTSTVHYCTLPLLYTTSTVLYLYYAPPLLYSTSTVPLLYSTSTVLYLYLYCTLPLLYSTSTSTVHYLYCTLLYSTSTVHYIYCTLPLLYTTVLYIYCTLLYYTSTVLYLY